MTFRTDLAYVWLAQNGAAEESCFVVILGGTYGPKLDIYHVGVLCLSYLSRLFLEAVKRNSHHLGVQLISFGGTCLN